MSISGIVVTLTDGVSGPRVHRMLAGDSRFTVGPLINGRLPAALEMFTDQEAEEVVRWLREVPGVAHVDVVYVSVEAPRESLAGAAEEALLV